MKHIYFIALTLLGLQAQAQQLSFPGAEGYGAYATGGRGGQVVHVTNLNASGSGSLADAVSKSGRIVVFDVGGVIDITGGGITFASNITVCGQTAPGEGITIYGGRVIMSKSSNVIVRYIRMRGGINLNQKKATLTMDEAQNVILDHCSISWGRWDDIHITNANNITYQNCIISEGIDPQRFGAITDGTRNWTITHCLWANNKSRNPKMKCGVQYVNNVVYNYAMGIIGGHSAADNYQDVIGNYFITGPSTGTNKYFDDWTATDHLYSLNNYTDDNRDGELNGRLITDYNGATPMSSPNFKTTHPLNIESPADAYAHIVDEVGASRVRDSHDRRIISQLTSLGREGAIIDRESDVGGIGVLGGGSPEKDTDRDGMPDAWEEANGTNPAVADATGDVDGNGYNNIEDYVNSLTHRVSYVLAPQNLTATAEGDAAHLQWSLLDTVDSVFVEMSTDGDNYTRQCALAGTATSADVTGLDAEKVYYFRAQCKADTTFSGYSNVARVHDEYMRGGGGTPAGVTVFEPEEGMFYRIINYATIPFNKATSNAGMPKYLCFNSKGALASTDQFQWDDLDLIWQITKTADGYTFRRLSDSRYIGASDVTIDGEARIAATDTPDVLTITHTGNVQLANAGGSSPYSVYRINSPSNKGYQIRAKVFENNWFWGSGTFDRADMVFTFAGVEASRLGVEPLTGITDVILDETGHSFDVSDEHEDVIYDLSGRRISPNDTLRPGIYIQNGKKWVVK